MAINRLPQDLPVAPNPPRRSRKPTLTGARLTPVLLGSLWLQKYPDSTWVQGLLQLADADRITGWMEASEKLWIADWHAWLDAVGIRDADLITRMHAFLVNLRMLTWFEPFQDAGWAVQDINPFVLRYLLGLLRPLYTTRALREDPTSADVPALPTISARVIACPWILVQGFWEASSVLTQTWGDPAQVLHTLAALTDQHPADLSPWEQSVLPPFAALILAFLQTTRRTGNSTLSIAPTYGRNWVAQAADWLSMDAEQMDTWLGAMQSVVDGPPSTSLQRVYATHFSPTFQFVQTTAEQGKPHFALRGVYWQEIRTTMMLHSRWRARAQDPLVPTFPLPADWDARLNAVTIGPNHEPLDREQREALTTLWESPITILTGPPGSGKTELLSVWARLMQAVATEHPDWPGLGRIRWMAPTGKAAEQICVRLGSLPMLPEDAPRTIHHQFQMYPQLIGYPNQAVVDQCAEDLYNGALVIDEFTMCDTTLLHAVVRAASWWNTDLKRYEAAPFRLIFSGDPDQLPPVSPGYPLAMLEVLDDRKAPPGVRHPHVRLETIRRNQMAEILRAIREGDAAQWPGLAGQTDVEFHHAASFDAWQTLIEHEVQRILQTRPLVERVVPQLLGATHDVVDPLNDRIQALLQPHPVTGRFMVGDKVLYQRNDSALDLVNGSDGIVVEAEGDHGQVEWNLPNGHTVVLPYTADTPMMLAYAITVHKAQGSEWPVTIVLAPAQTWFEANTDTQTTPSTEIHGWHDRRLAYTALSRGKPHVIILSGLPLEDFVQTVTSLPARRRVSQLERSLRWGKYAIPWNDRIPAHAPKKSRHT